MATRTLSVITRFPVGTSVSAYVDPGAGLLDQAPTGAPVATAAVAGDGTVTFTAAGLVVGPSYVAYAKVNGEHRYTRFQLKTGTTPLSWKDVHTSRKTAAGTA